MDDSVTSIGDQAFAYCVNLSSVTFGDGLTTINSKAFYASSKLKSIFIPDSITSIANNAFGTGLETVYMNSTAASNLGVSFGVKTDGFFGGRPASSLSVLIVEGYIPEPEPEPESYPEPEPCLLYTSPSPRDLYRSRMPSSA